MRSQAIILRADAGETMGTGHVMRCIALAQELLLRGCEIHLVMASPPAFLVRRLEEEGFSLHCLSSVPGSRQDAHETARLAGAAGASWVILDGYHFDAEYQMIVKSTGLHLLCIDDYGHAGQYHADIILNQNIYAGDIPYPDTPGRLLLLGPRYALLRKEILSWRGSKGPVSQKAFNILVTVGGSDPKNATLQIVRALQELPVSSFSAKIVVGGSNHCKREISQCAASTGHSMEILKNVRDMGELYAWADFAISGAGSTTLELALFGIPMITVAIADNQQRVGESLERSGAAISLGSMDPGLGKRVLAAVKRLMQSRALREQLSHNADALVDGEGVGRVCDCMDQSAIILRKAVASDCQTVFSWINDPGIREVSFSTEPILWDEHMGWFLSRISDPGTVYYLIWTTDRVPVGQVRYDIEDADATISLLVDPRFRGRNISVTAMRRSAELLFNHTGVKKIHAYIKPSNEISCKAFRRAGYDYQGTVTKGTGRARHMILTRGKDR